jgi:hypothetical protein
MNIPPMALIDSLAGTGGDQSRSTSGWPQGASQGADTWGQPVASCSLPPDQCVKSGDDEHRDGAVRRGPRAARAPRRADRPSRDLVADRARADHELGDLLADLAGLAILVEATSWSSAARMAASAAAAPRSSGSKLIVFADRAVDGV